MRRVWAVIGIALAGWLAGTSSWGNPPRVPPIPLLSAQAADSPTEATVTDAEGKEVKVAALKFGAGTHRLSWLADPNGTTEDAKKGPLVLEVREPHSTIYKKGIVTYVPVGSIESIKYDYEKKVALFAVKGLPDPVAGTLRYQGFNSLAFSGTADDKAANFVAASGKGNIKAVAFPDAKPVASKKAQPPWMIQIDQPEAEYPTLKASNFKFLYQFPGGVEVLAEGATLRKGEPLKLDDSVKAFTPVAVDQNIHMAAAVEVQIGDVEKIVVLPLEIEKDGKKGRLAGLLGEVDAGWKFFPLHTIKSMKRPKKD